MRSEVLIFKFLFTADIDPGLESTYINVEFNLAVFFPC